jgi:hypothetical protein
MADTMTEKISQLDSAQRALDAASQGAQGMMQPWTPDLVSHLSFGVLVFSAFTLVIAAILLWRARASPAYVLKVVGVVSIIAFSAVLLVAGYSNSQLTPIVGLFGAIAGYLLGKDTNGEKKE